jgi:Repeat of unknown function (DUF5648)
MKITSYLSVSNHWRILKKCVFIISLTLLLSCVSEQNDSSENLLTTGIAASVKDSKFGQAASAEEVKVMSEQLGSYFKGQHASNPQSLMGEQGKASNSTAVTPMAASNVSQPVFRFYNTKTQTHFFTMSADERDYVITTWPTIFNFEGNSFFAYPASDPILSPVYRFYNQITGAHFFTINAAEKDYVIATWPTIFRYEGISWYASTGERTGWVPVYRFFNTKTGTHFYTTSLAEKNHVLATWSWFTFEGIAYYVRQDAQTIETINGIVVPPAPDSLLNNTTLAGIDSNSNGVRDDVEREFARTAPSNFNELMSWGNDYQKIITQQSKLSVESYEKLNCMGSRIAEITSNNEFENKILNTDERRSSYTEMLSSIDQFGARMLTIEDLCNE